MKRIPEVHTSEPHSEQRTDDVTASELAAFAYCAKAWHLERVLRVQPSMSVARRREAGVHGHVRHGVAVRAGSLIARHSRQMVAALVLAAVVFTLLALALG